LVGGGPLPALVAQRNLELRPLVAPALFLFAAPDLFDDPRLEHRREPLAKCVQYPCPLVKFGSLLAKLKTAQTRRKTRASQRPLIWILDLPRAVLAHEAHLVTLAVGHVGLITDLDDRRVGRHRRTQPDQQLPVLDLLLAFPVFAQLVDAETGPV